MKKIDFKCVIDSCVILVTLFTLVILSVIYYVKNGKKNFSTVDETALYLDHEYFLFSEYYIILPAGGEVKTLTMKLENGTKEDAKKVKWKLKSYPEKIGTSVCKVEELSENGNIRNFQITPKSLGNATLEFFNKSLSTGNNWQVLFISVVTESEYKKLVENGYITSLTRKHDAQKEDRTGKHESLHTRNGR